MRRADRFNDERSPAMRREERARRTKVEIQAEIKRLSRDPRHPRQAPWA